MSDDGFCEYEYSAEALSRLLLRNSALHTLDLRGLSMTGPGLALVAGALAKNRTLRFLALAGVQELECARARALPPPPPPPRPLAAPAISEALLG